MKDNIESISNKKPKRLIIHELFHILSRNNQNFRKEMYEIIGFQIMDEIQYPENIEKIRITNPDAPRTDSFISLIHEGEKMDCTMILYADGEYNGGELFRYLNVRFLKLKGSNNKEIVYSNSNPIVFSRNEVEGFYEQVGRNTRYTIHPEEILAENFVYAFIPKADLPNPEIVKKIVTKLK